LDDEVLHDVLDDDVCADVLYDDVCADVLCDDVSNEGAEDKCEDNVFALRDEFAENDVNVSSNISDTVRLNA
jgi:hypothetical protein